MNWLRVRHESDPWRGHLKFRDSDKKEKDLELLGLNLFSKIN